jgi:hypothetical protein
MLINGGAAVTLLAFVGNLWRAPNTSHLVKTIGACINIVSGVALAALSSAATYICQFCYALSGPSRGTSFLTGVVFHILAVPFGFGFLRAIYLWNMQGLSTILQVSRTHILAARRLHLPAMDTFWTHFREIAV